jgi:hypothetical protein
MPRALFRLWVVGAILHCGWWNYKSLALTQGNPAFERLWELLVYNAVALVIALCALMLLWIIARVLAWRSPEQRLFQLHAAGIGVWTPDI